MVWDTIYGRDPDQAPVHEWGGIAYALAALEASLPETWRIVPLIKVGRDFATEANGFLGRLTHRAGAARFVEVPERNNQVTLRYESKSRRCEHLSGGVPPWTWMELGPLVHDVDALYVNFISGFEMTLETSQYLRHGFRGPIYADLHSLFLGVAADGLRVPQPLEHAAAWFSCFDVLQLNSDEMALLGPDPMAVAARALGEGVGVVVVTMGPQGAVYFAREGFSLMKAQHSAPAATPAPRTHATGPIKTARVPSPLVLGDADPTGCGDVFGATLVAHLVGGSTVESGIAAANQLASRNLTHRGATNLQYHLRGEIAPR
jgi:hypothetical protein